MNCTTDNNLASRPVPSSSWRLKTGRLLLLSALVCFALAPIARAVSPAPDGGYPGANTAEGDDALFSLTTGVGNTASGFDALYSNTDGYGNTATGATALFFNTTGSDNTATGFDALLNNTTGVQNTATGLQALYSNTTGAGNTATGLAALFFNTNGNDNTANGDSALYSNTTGNNNTAAGVSALQANTTGSNNMATGVAALSSNTTGSSNIALGSYAGLNLTTGNNNIDIGNAGVAAEASTIRIGTVGAQTNAFMAGIYGTTVAKGLAVVIDSSGHLGTKGSSERFKDAIKPMDGASEALLALKPVTFHYKKELDPEGIPQFGLIAEEVAKVNPDLVARDDQGKIYTVRYDAVNAMLLNEFLKEHQIVQQQQKEIAALKAELKEQRAFIQKVNEKVEMSRPAPQLVTNNP